MAEKKRDDDIFDELADAASLFDEIGSLPDREDIGDILFVEGIEDDESVIDEDILSEEEAAAPQKPARPQPVLHEPEETMTIAQKLSPKRRPPARKKTEAIPQPEPAVVSSSASANGVTIGEFFAPLVRQCPASKIRVEANTIGSVFQGFIR